MANLLGRVAVTLVSLGLVGCSAVSPPPLVPMHAGTAPQAVDETTVTVVVGVAGEVLGGGGWGVAVRAERQVRDRASLGVQLGGGRGDEGLDDDGHLQRHWLLEVRGYGRLQSPTHDWAAGLASVGLTAMDTGLLASTLAVGAAVSYPNQYAVPALGGFAAVSRPWRRGDGFGPSHDRYVHTTWWLGASAALVVPIGDTGNAPSVEVGVAKGLGHDGLVSASLADSHAF